MVTNNDFHESVFVGSLTRGMTFAAVNIGSPINEEMGQLLSSLASCLELELNRVCP